VRFLCTRELTGKRAAIPEQQRSLWPARKEPAPARIRPKYLSAIPRRKSSFFAGWRPTRQCLHQQSSLRLAEEACGNGGKVEHLT
jgi:hypothetical protein